ncbi:MAG: hypothetical protein J6A59_01360 [Lachnospiraceae bacterium]|nr:hypothetical protein [Lachnospiraceae bacterium]
MIKVGDYVEGFEKLGTKDYNIKRIMRGTVTKVVKTENDDIQKVEVMADDEFYGTRGAILESKYGRIIHVNKELHWMYKSEADKEKVIIANNLREFKENYLVEDNKGKLFRLIHFGFNYANENDTMIVLERMEDHIILVLPIKEFVGKTNGKYNFYIVNTNIDNNKGDNT